MATSMPFNITSGVTVFTLPLIRIPGWFTYIMVWHYVCIFLAFWANILPVLAYIKYHQLQTPTNMLICNQSVADLLFSLIGNLYEIFYYTNWGVQVVSRMKYVCLISYTFSLILLQASAANLFLLSMERFIAVIFPFKYYVWVTETAVKKILIGEWTFVILTTGLPVFGLNNWETGQECTLAVFT